MLRINGYVQAGSISCGSATITDDQVDAPLTERIITHCGAPTSKDGNDWIYDRRNVGEGFYILHCNGAGELESIDEQPD
jgi:hypothetical protein